MTSHSHSIPTAAPRTWTHTLISRTELPTWLAVIAVHAAWFALLNFYTAVGVALVLPLILVLAWHSSICHEILHGHPTRIAWLNDLLAQLPLALLIPYFTFKTNHLRHHNNANITLPAIDPESFFADDDVWRAKNPVTRAFAHVQMTLAGRLLFGPSMEVYKMFQQLGADMVMRRWGKLAQYVIHFIFVAAIISAVHFYFAMPVWLYFIAAYCSQSIMMLRAFYEHRPHPSPAKRTVIMESCAPMRLLFLNNNYHAVHHAHPNVPWYEIPREYQRNRARYLHDNGGFHYRGYWQWLKYFFKPVAEPVHSFAEQNQPRR